MSGIEMRYGDYLNEGWEIVKANLVSSLIAGLVMGIPLLGWIVAINYLAAVKAAKHEGKPIEPGALFNFENAGDKVIVCAILTIAGMIGSMIVVGGFLAAALLYYAPSLVADKPGTPFMNAIKGSFEFSKANLVPMLILTLVMSVVYSLGIVLCCVGTLITGPLAMAASYLSYEDHKSGIEAAAAEAGIQL